MQSSVMQVPGSPAAIIRNSDEIHMMVPEHRAADCICMALAHADEKTDLPASDDEMQFTRRSDIL